MKVEIIRFPTDTDWARCYTLAVVTAGRDMDGHVPIPAWRNKILKSEHSPVRTLMWTIRLVEVPYFVSVHFSRHKFGVEHYVRSQRNDRQSLYDRNSAPQNAPVTHILDINAAELMELARARLCGKADPTTRTVMNMIADAVEAVSPEMGPFLVPRCKHMGTCREPQSCGMNDAALKPF